jgi:dienelactone hydrolase
MAPVERFSSASSDPPVIGYLHRAESASGDGLVLTHGAGGNAQSGLLVALAETFAAAGFAVLRCDLPFRQVRRFGLVFDLRLFGSFELLQFGLPLELLVLVIPR